MASKEADKGTRYVALLYEARCSNRWQDVSELARKVEKHASGRRCFTLAARADALLHISPGREGCKEADEQFGEVLSSAIRESTNAGDILDASTLHAALFYGKAEPELALTQVPESLHRTRSPTSGVGSEAWLAVCVLRGSLIRGLSFEAQNNQEGAATTYRSIIAYVAKVVILDQACPALRQAAEELITHVCLYFAASTEKHQASMGEAMAAFHVLSQLLDRQSGKFMAARGTFTKDTPRQFWRTYYRTLSMVMDRGLVYHPSPLDRDHDTIEHTGLLSDDDFLTARRQQRTDLRRVQMSYESILLAETKFPKANETNENITEWVELVMNNWRTLCGPSWTDQEVGEGGKAAVGRNTLDILYRAQTKTFHSTQVLRYLVTVHAYLAEFDLAFKAFDSYVEILTKGKARAKKTGSAGMDLDDDNMALTLAAEAIRIACRFGPPRIIKKAYVIGQMVEKWLEHGSPDSPMGVYSSNILHTDALKDIAANNEYSEETLGLAYRSVGISRASWSRYNHDSDSRKRLLENAVLNLRASLRYRSRPEHSSTETFFTLGLSYAELARPEEATTVIDFGLGSPATRAATSNTSSTLPAHKEQAHVDAIGLLPLHHLQALLQSASEDYEASALTCEEALEKAAAHGSSQQPRQNAPGSFNVVASNMDNYDKQNAIELKMTQIRLAGVTGGAERAVNASNELIALYSQLYGPVAARKPQSQPQPNQPRPKSSSGTIRSMFSRRASRRVAPGASVENPIPPSNLTSAPPSGNASALPSRPQTMATAPAINVIPEAEEEPNEDLEVQPADDGFGSSSKDATPRRSLSLQNRNGRGDKKLSSRPHTSEGEKAFPRLQPDGSGAQAGGAQPMEGIPHNLPTYEKLDRPTGHTHQPPKQDTRLPVPPPRSGSYAPPPQFLHLQGQKFRLSLLIKVWLFIGQLYKSCSLFTDAEEAVEEAHTLAEQLELELSVEEASVKHLQDCGWAGGKSVEDLWADILAERGNLLVAQSRPHDGLLNFEKALTHQPNHTLAITGLASLLLDIYEQKIPSEKPEPVPVAAIFSTADNTSANANVHVLQGVRNGHGTSTLSVPPAQAVAKLSAQQVLPKDGAPDTLALYRTAARDRAYGLLASITSLPEGASDAQAWLTLSRAHELSGQMQEARTTLWRVIDLENVAPVRSWREVGPGGYVLW